MAFDGITIACLKKEINDLIFDCRISKIAQPERDEIILTVKKNKEQIRLLLSADPSLPLAYFLKENKVSPLDAPNFCMVLRKHIQNARIIGIHQHGLDRILEFELEHFDEMGDLKIKKLILELMGRYSNLIFTNEDGIIIDSIRRVSDQISSVREVLPGKRYCYPGNKEKIDLLKCTRNEFMEKILMCSNDLSVPIFIQNTLIGVSKESGNEICRYAGISNERTIKSLTELEVDSLWESLLKVISVIQSGAFCPHKKIYETGKADYSVLNLEQDPSTENLKISDLLINFYHEKNQRTRINQKSTDLRKIVSNHLERCNRKLILQNKQMEDTFKKDKYQLYGELLQIYAYQIEDFKDKVELENYHDSSMVMIPMDKDLTPMENSIHYFNKYGKLKRTAEALTVQIQKTLSDINYLESVQNALEIAMSEEDLNQIREELFQQGYLKKRGDKRNRVKSEPLHFITSDGFHIYVGKNNMQNEEITFQIATGNDWWFHAKGMPGSHVIVKTQGQELSDQAFEEAGRLAAFYSKGRGSEKIEVDYTRKKNVKKPAGSAPGYVIYHTNFSMVVNTNIDDIKVIS